MCKKPLFLSLFLEKRGQIGKKSKKSCCRHQLRTMTYFSKYHTFDPLWYLGCQMLQTHFFFTFSAKNRSNNKIFGKKTYGHQLGPMTHFLTTLKFDLLFIYRGEVPAHTFAKLSVRALITDLKKFDPKKVISVKSPRLAMWPTSLSRPKYFGTSPKLPVHALIHDPSKKTYGHQLGPMTHFLTTQNLTYFYI